MDNWTYIIFGLIGLLTLLFALLQLWFWTLRQKEIKEAKRTVKELTDKNTPKLTREEQFNFIDGNWNFTKIQNILDKKEFSLLVLDYFIDIMPNEYLEYLRKNPPTIWNEDSDVEAKIQKSNDGFKIIYYYRGETSSYKFFKDYDKLLKYLVYERLTNIGYKYKKLLNKNYYS